MKKDKFIIISFLIIIFGVLIIYPIKHILITTNIIDFNISDNWVFYTPKTENNVIDKFINIFNSSKTSLENRITNYFPLYNNLNSIYQNINFNSNKLLYKDIIPIKTNTDNEYVFFDNVNKFYYYETSYNHKELNDRLKKQIDFFNNLGLDIYIYLPTRYELTNISNNSLSNYIDEFKNSLNSNIKLKVMNIENITDYNKMFYSTDHHWNGFGALNGYYEIMDLLNENAVDNLFVSELKDVKYYGSISKNIMNDSIYDFISDINVDLKYDVLVNGKSAPSIFKPRNLKINNKYKYYDYYVQYFNGQFGEVVYDYNNDSLDNLLILSDSYAWPIDYLIAASFNKTHVINLRYDKYKKEIFNINEYIENNNIDKILFLYEGGSTLFDQYDYDFIGKVK